MEAMIVTALAVMVTATMAVHLGLSPAVAGVVSKILSCEMCLTFWLSLAALYLVVDADIVPAIFVSVVASYASHWLGLALTELTHLYEQLWQRQKRKWSLKRGWRHGNR